MSLKINTKNSEGDRYLTLTQTNNIYSLFIRDNTEYTSYFPFAYKSKDDGKFIGYAGSIKNNDYEDDSFDDAIPKDIDLYICLNGSKTEHSRKSDSIINLQNIVIDIDSHNSTLSPKELSKHINDLKDNLIDKLLIKPNLINCTGRGLHLWYCIEPCHVSLSKIWMSVVDMLCSNVEKCMEELNETELQIDKPSSLKINGLFRVPYSYNTKIDMWSEATKLHDETPHLTVLQGKLKAHGYSSPYFDTSKKPKKRPSTHQYTIRKDIKASDYFPCLIHRKRFLEYLFKNRSTGEGQRNIMLFAMYATTKELYGKSDAIDYCTQLNASLEKPLMYHELISIFKEVNKKNHRFKNEHFLNFVQATAEERLYFKSVTAKELKKESNRQKKSERNERILSLYNQGISITEISKIVAVSRPTVYNVINQ